MTEQFDGPNATPVTAGAPDWFRAALGVPYEEHSVEVAGCPIHYLAWGAPGRQGLVFVHGGGAHARWWTHIAARFSSEFRVLAVDLSGHGDSGQRETYTLDQWTEEVMAVAADGGVAEVERAIVRAVDDPAVSVKRKWRAIAPPPSPRDATLFAAVAASTREVWPDVVVAPSLLPAATDGKYLRGAGIPTYGVTGIFEDVDDVREHGDDERVGAREIDEASRFFSALVRRLAAR
jgi:pimeloyl-ACP methyl ester carboxylesterase